VGIGSERASRLFIVRVGVTCGDSEGDDPLGPFATGAEEGAAAAFSLAPPPISVGMSLEGVLWETYHPIPIPRPTHYPTCVSNDSDT